LIEATEAKDAAASPMHKPLLALALFTTLVVAGITVHLQVRARLRTYEMARLRTGIVELEEACDAVRVRVVALQAPERVSAAARRLREARLSREGRTRLPRL
jgi:cell division protein FtsL